MLAGKQIKFTLYFPFEIIPNLITKRKNTNGEIISVNLFFRLIDKYKEFNHQRAPVPLFQ